jgi:ribosome-associated toxin RatA of RatAB toxin-antitoxin module
VTGAEVGGRHPPPVDTVPRCGLVWPAMSLEGAQEFAVEVAATPQQCFAAITDFEAYPDWSTAVEHAAVLDRDRSGIGRVVEFRIDMRFKSVRYVLEYAYKKPNELTWHSVDGDIESIEGKYTFRKLGAKRSEAICRQQIVVGFWVPGPLRKLAERSALRQSVTEFKQEVERRLGVGDQ